jgi:O-antigen/teichoic acid export membrane protein
MLVTAAAPLFLYLYGSGFAGAQAPYLILIVAQGLFFFTHLNYMLIFARGRMRTGWALTLVALAVNLTANFLLIPPMGPSGAALAMVLSEAALLAAQAPIIRSLISSSSDAITAVVGDQESAARAA